MSEDYRKTAEIEVEAERKRAKIEAIKARMVDVDRCRQEEERAQALLDKEVNRPVSDYTISSGNSENYTTGSINEGGFFVSR